VRFGVLVMIEEGRLGNQVFQYLALRAAAQQRELVVMLGCDDLAQTFDGVQARTLSIDHGPFRHLRSLDRRRISRNMRRVHLGGLLTESADASPTRDSKHGLVLCDRGWFQTQALLQGRALGMLRIKPRWLLAASRSLADYGLDPLTTLIVHARGGDYRTWPSQESPALVPPTWFARQVANVRETTHITAVLVMGDDPEYSREVQVGIPDSCLHHASGPGAQSHDLALLSLVPYLVISPSTFGFWGAWFGRQVHRNGRAIAPRHWAGHRQQTWFPATIEAAFLEYQECIPLDYEVASGGGR
jgi:hypothetical protein